MPSNCTATSMPATCCRRLGMATRRSSKRNSNASTSAHGISRRTRATCRHRATFTSATSPAFRSCSCATPIVRCAVTTSSTTTTTDGARSPDSEVSLLDREIVEADIAFVVEHIGTFGDDNRAGIERTLHRITAIRNRHGNIVGLLVVSVAPCLAPSTSSTILWRPRYRILIMGRPGIGKTTMLREAARVLADDMGKRVVVVDTSNEIAGDGDIPHPAIGKARRMQVRTPSLQHEVMIEAVENHMPQVIIIDEIGTELEAAGGPHHRRARRPADRHGARQQPRQPDAQPDPVRPDRRDPERDPR